MALSDMIKADLAACHFSTEDHAVTVTYSGTDIDAVVDYGQDQEQAADATVTRAMLHVKVSDVAAPAYRDTVVIGSDTWRVSNIKEGDGYVWKLGIILDERTVI